MADNIPFYICATSSLCKKIEKNSFNLTIFGRNKGDLREKNCLSNISLWILGSSTQLSRRFCYLPVNWTRF